MSRALIAPLALLATATAAQATTFASGKLYGGPNQNEVACYILNTGARTVTLSGLQIAGENGVAVLLQGSCSGSLKAHTGCEAFTTQVSTTTAYDCSMNVPSNVVYLRGSIEIRDRTGSGTDVLQVQPLR